MGDVTDLSNFLGAVIDRRAFDRLAGVLKRVRNDERVGIVAGRMADDSEGYFVRPTILLSSNPDHEIFRDEYFGPILAVYVYPNNDFDAVLDLVDRTAPYGLTGSIIATDRAAIAEAAERLRFTAGNFYINDKPTGAVVGQQPFGGSRASGTNDKAGSLLNLRRWVSPRTITETFVPPAEVPYVHQQVADRTAAGPRH
jgi:1-pyrroline-5-carboxylate dehydrogenase